MAHSALDEGAFELSSECLSRKTWSHVHCSDTDSEGFHLRLLPVPSRYWMAPVAGLSPGRTYYLGSFEAPGEYWETSRLESIAKRRR